MNRLEVKGNITWKGQPIPMGVIIFDPDVTKNNKGPQGYATIHDGKYDTSSEKSKGCVAGFHKVNIQGFDGKDLKEFQRYGHRLFEPYETTVEIPSSGGTLNFVVPDSVKLPEKTNPSDL